jgi:hypothetical protein
MSTPDISYYRRFLSFQFLPASWSYRQSLKVPFMTNKRVYNCFSVSRNNTVFFESSLKQLLAIFAKIILRLNHRTYHRELYWKVYQNKEPIFLRLSYSYHIYIRIFSFMSIFWWSVINGKILWTKNIIRSGSNQIFL